VPGPAAPLQDPPEDAQRSHPPLSERTHLPRFARADEDATPAPEFAGAAGLRGIAISIACVTINKSQQWWRGTEAADLDELLREFAAASYPVDRVAHAKCSNCDAAVFDVVLDDEEGCAALVVPAARAS
jgi:hypothetical protein